jgi:hypothetical protein
MRYVTTINARGADLGSNGVYVFAWALGGRGVDRLMRTAVVLQDNLLATEALVAELLFATWGASRCNDWVARAVSWVEGVTATV